eukprot:scaffold21064_cov31-Tisochrysis_lutea.AAC.5
MNPVIPQNSVWDFLCGWGWGWGCAGLVRLSVFVLALALGGCRLEGWRVENLGIVNCDFFCPLSGSPDTEHTRAYEGTHDRRDTAPVPSNVPPFAPSDVPDLSVADEVRSLSTTR